MDSILGYTPAELGDVLVRDGQARYRSAQILRWVYRRGVLNFHAMTDLDRSLRHSLSERWGVTPLELQAVHEATDGTRKLALSTAEGARIETVIIPEEQRRTVCISTQVGCSLACRFCATGMLGLDRNLRSEEIVAQWLHAWSVLAPAGEHPTHVVFMGMGEPLLNLGNVLQAIRVLTDPLAGGLSPRRITVSTAGVVPRMGDLGQGARVRLAVSLHATSDAVRDELVPINRRFPLAELLAACRAYPVARRDRISFEYILIRGVNDSFEDARRLPWLLRGIPAKINLIPMNEHPGASDRRPDDLAIERFIEVVSRGPVPVSVRRSRGDDILAACGQLGAGSSKAGTLALGQLQSGHG